MKKKTTDYTYTYIEEYPMAALKPHPMGYEKPVNANPRRKFSGITKLAASIKAEGLLNPIRIVIIEHEDDGSPGAAFIEDGERRFRAFKQLDREYIPAFVIHDAVARGNDGKRIEDIHNAMLLHNNRQELSPLDLAHGLKIQLEWNRTPLDLSIAYSLPIERVHDLIALLDAPEAVQKLVNGGAMSMSAFRLIKNKPAETQQAAAELKKPTVAAVSRVTKVDKTKGRIDNMLDSLDCELAVYARINDVRDEIARNWAKYTASEQAQIVTRLQRLSELFATQQEE